jgi:hypothetical protein
LPTHDIMANHKEWLVDRMLGEKRADAADARSPVGALGLAHSCPEQRPGSRSCTPPTLAKLRRSTRAQLL